jgi:hypothetical protein
MYVLVLVLLRCGCCILFLCLRFPLFALHLVLVVLAVDGVVRINCVDDHGDDGNHGGDGDGIGRC